MKEEENQKEQQEALEKIYGYAANLLFEEKKESDEVKSILISEGLDKESAIIVVDELKEEFKNAKKEQANKDMLYGALWCVGGIIASVADFGYFFWGAILFGGFQFFKGVFNSSK